ncbi:MAG TPA: carbohydrate kinase family protein [Blastocatellia bacterium]|nr:carbohydrate kinase family protein [Blastocatellia bacterium]
MKFAFSIPADRRFDVVGFGLNAVDHLVTIPRFPQFNTKVRLSDHRQMPGGQVSSAMVGAQRLGLRASYIGKVGYDNEGRMVIESLQKEGVDCSHVRIAVGAKTQGAVIIIEQFSGERTILWYHDDGTRIAAEELKREMITEGRVLHLDGFDTQAALQAARWARESGMPVTIDLDTIYPGIDELLPLVDCLITSQALANDLTGTMDEREALKRLHERYGCYLVAMTQGARGALAYVDQEYLASSAFRPPVIRDTTGAGDAFRAGFIYGLCQGLEIEESMRVANAVAALQCREMGARDGLPTEAELKEFLAKG